MVWSNPTRAEVLAVALATGETVIEAWSAWDKGAMGTVMGPMLHHTGSAWSFPRLIAPTLRVVREGRSDLQNSLCMYYIDYAGVIYCINNRLSWHAGGGNWNGITDGNGRFAGIEAESDGRQWTEATRRSYVKLVAAINARCGTSVHQWAPRHAEYALPQGRKTDFSGMDAGVFKNDAEFLRVNGIAPMMGDDVGHVDSLSIEALKAIRDFVWRDPLPENQGAAILHLLDIKRAAMDPITSVIDPNAKFVPRDMLAIIDGHAFALRQEVAGLRSALDLLVNKVGSQEGASAEELKAVIEDAMKKVVRVEVGIADQ